MAVAVLAGCGGGASFTAKGTLALVALDSATNDCASGTGGYSDIQEGASVVIYDAGGKKIAVGSLKAGRDYEDGLCVFDFAVPDVPSGDGPYGVEVANRGQVTFKEDGADSIVISLGG